MLSIEHQGTVHELTFGTREWDIIREGADPAKRAMLDQIARHGTILGKDGKPLEEAQERRVRSRLLGEFSHLPQPGGLGDSEHVPPRRMLVEGLWPWGTIPMLAGQPKAGKSTLVVDLVASLVRGEEFLGQFPVASLVAEQSRLGTVWLINAETPPDDLNRSLYDRLVDDPDDAAWGVMVDHLELLGGPQRFDLTDPDLYDLWAHRLVQCYECDGADDNVPAVVIVDGLTAILAASGKGTDHYGLWYAAFRRLMRELDVPNALVVGHNTLAGGHLMGGVEAQAGADGLWNLTSSSPDDPLATRRFSVVPRMGGSPIPPTPVDLVDGRLLLRRKGSTSPIEPSPTVEPPEDEALVLEYVTACNAQGYGPSARDLRTNVGLPNVRVDRAARDLVTEGRLTERPRVGRGGGKSLWLPN